jgi:hypothetical protein
MKYIVNVFILDSLKGLLRIVHNIFYDSHVNIFTMRIKILGIYRTKILKDITFCQEGSGKKVLVAYPSKRAILRHCKVLHDLITNVRSLFDVQHKRNIIRQYFNKYLINSV